MRFHPVVIASMMFMLLVFTACGGDGDATNGNPELSVEPTGITVENPWVRPAILPAGHPSSHTDEDDSDHSHHGSGVISAMYLTISNDRGQAVQLTAVETSIAEVIEIHQTENQNGLMRMQPVQAVEIPAGGTVEFAPGGHHVMLIDITEQLDAGDTISATLVFNTGERIELPDVPVIDQ